MDAIDWASLSACFGPAVEVPGFLGLFRDDDEEASAAALSDLYSWLCHQGTVYEATPVAVPFIAGIAADPEVSLVRRTDALMLLADIASAVTFVIPGLPGPQQAGVPVDGVDLARDSYVAVAAQLPNLVPDDTDSRLVAGLAAVTAAVITDAPDGLIGRLTASPILDDTIKNLLRVLRTGDPMAAAVREAIAADPDRADLTELLDAYTPVEAAQQMILDLASRPIGR